MLVRLGRRNALALRQSGCRRNAAVPAPTKKPQAALIDGIAAARDVRHDVREGVNRLEEDHGVTPGLGLVLVGERNDSRAYRTAERRSCPLVLMVLRTSGGRRT